MTSSSPEPRAVDLDLVGDCPAMRELKALLARVAGADAPVLIQGESGTGKELVARAIHRLSRRGGASFLAVNCGALAGGLLESEIFGHVAGAFTGARARRRGLFEEADRGTLLLDEVAATPVAFQAKLLRVIEDGVVRPVGGSRPIRTDVRLIAASNVDLKEAVRDGRFREDLYYRLDVVSFRLPPLRARGADVELLARHFVRRAAASLARPEPEIGGEFVARLRGHDWPGNVRELRNAIERAVLLAEGGRLQPGHLRLEPAAGHRRGALEPYRRAKQAALASFTRGYLEDLLAAAGGNVSRAAAIARLPRQTVHRLMRSHRLRRGDFRGA